LDFFDMAEMLIETDREVERHLLTGTVSPLSLQALWLPLRFVHFINEKSP